MFSKVAIVESAQQMDHRDISNAVHSVCVFRVAGAATSDVSFCSVFLSLIRENTTEKIGYTFFDLSVLILGLCLYVYHH
jgi:hypothetical protein